MVDEMVPDRDRPVCERVRECRRIDLDNTSLLHARSLPACRFGCQTRPPQRRIGRIIEDIRLGSQRVTATS
jgi:hypothetical protein